MKNLYLFLGPLVLWVLWSGNAAAQTTIRGTVRDADSKTPLPYCNIRIQGTNKGTIANLDGGFSLVVNAEKDSLVFSFVGYEKRKVAASSFSQPLVVYLKQTPQVLSNVSIYADDDYLYEMMERCRKNLIRQSGNRTVKTYFGLETKISGQPAELIEGYYNAYLDGVNIEDLRLKNGRIGLAVVGSRLFNSIETSKALSMLDLTHFNSLFPSIPLQYHKREMQRVFELVPGKSDKATLHILFSPREKSGEHFSGEAWIDKSTHALIKIKLFVEETDLYPFVSLWDDSIRNVSMEINQQFTISGQRMLPEYIQFNYRFNYETASSEVRLVLPGIEDMARDISTKSVLYFYDYSSPFILPWFEYEADRSSDYRKLAMIPYNDFFWRNNNAMLLTESQKTSLGFYADEGMLINFREGNYGKGFLKSLGNDTVGYNFPYAFWGNDKRIYLSKGMIQNETWPPEKINQHILSDLYHFKVQILLDITQAADSFYCVSYTVFDETGTFFHLPIEESTTLFLNIYFDLCEIERRKMDAVLHQKIYALDQIDSLYKATQSDIETITQKYMKEVQLGKNTKMVEKWNGYVMERLGINNLEIFITDPE